MDWLWDISTISGPLPWIVLILGALGLLWLVAVPTKKYLLLVVPTTAVLAVAVTALVAWFVESVWKPFADPIPTADYVWGGAALFAALLFLPRLIHGSGVISRTVTVLATVAAIVMGLAQINQNFDEYPTVGTVFGINNVETVSLAEAERGDVKSVDVNTWKRPEDLTGQGKVATTPIAGIKSGFAARPAEIYLPPAYFSNPRPRLPVLVLLAGQPGSPQDWLVGGRLTETMDQYAATKNGLSPIVVVADATGSELANPMCLDSDLGNVATYLTQDVPDWVKQNLQVNTDPAGWSIGGLSYGGTCSIQMSTNYPNIYPTFLDISGQLEPTLGDRKQTVNAAFGGDESKFTAINPMDLMKTRQYPSVAGAIVAGKDDAEYRDGQQQIFRQAQAAGMDVHLTMLPGGHSFQVWATGLKKEMPWLGQRLGLP